MVEIGAGSPLRTQEPGKRTLVAFILAGLLVGCQASGEPPPHGPSRAWGDASQGLRCSIAVEMTPWTQGGPALVSVVVENVSGSERTLATIPAFTLCERRYWAPVELVGDDPALPANARSRLSLAPGASVQATVDLTALSWDRATSSVWPSRGFFAVVPPGTCALRLDIEVVEGCDPAWIRSNEVEVEIRK